MNIHYVYAHPGEHSLNASLMKAGIDALKSAGDIITTSDLYAQHFNPALNLESAATNDIKHEMINLAQADHLVLQFPLWWFSVPAVMKGWFDRVFVKGFAYDFGKTFDSGLLRGKTASLIITAQSPSSAYQHDGSHRASLNEFLLPIHHTLHFVGIKPLAPFVVYDAMDIEQKRFEAIKADLKSYLQGIKSRANQG